MRRLEQHGAVAFTCMAVAVGILALPPNCLGNRDHLRKYFPKASAGLFARAKMQSPIKAVIHLLRCVIDRIESLSSHSGAKARWIADQPLRSSRFSARLKNSRRHSRGIKETLPGPWWARSKPEALCSPAGDSWCR